MIQPISSPEWPTPTRPDHPEFILNASSWHEPSVEEAVCHILRNHGPGPTPENPWGIRCVRCLTDFRKVEEMERHRLEESHRHFIVGPTELLRFCSQTLADPLTNPNFVTGFFFQLNRITRKTDLPFEYLSCYKAYVFASADTIAANIKARSAPELSPWSAGAFRNSSR